MKVGSIFSGIGGIDYAFAAAGFSITYQIEQDAYCQRVLARHFPHTKRYGDIFDVRNDDLPAVDVICAGFPCQPFSLAGKQRGADDERSLWPELRRIIAAHYPAVVFLENVPGLRSNDGGDTFKRILRELAEIGYLCEWHHLRTGADFGAPHSRERVFIVAYATGTRSPLTRACRFKTRQSRPKHSRYANDRQRRKTSNRLPQSRMGGAAYGLPARLASHQWPAPRGAAQYAHEAPRTVGVKVAYHNNAIKAYGNAVVPQAVYPVACAIREWLMKVLA